MGKRQWMGFVFVVVCLTLGAARAQAEETVSGAQIQAAVDEYLGRSEGDADLIGGPGRAGYDRGFVLRGDDFSLRTNVILQTRYEAFLWNDTKWTANGNPTGFSLPRALLRFSGAAPCSTRYYVELDFGHDGGELAARSRAIKAALNQGPDNQAFEFRTLREAWIETGRRPTFLVRMGQIATPTTRQLMVRPEFQQFVDIALGSSWIGSRMPGWTDRSRDFGILLHGVLGERTFSYAFAVTNGDGGDGLRNVLDPRTSDNLAFSGRLNWAFLEPVGYREGSAGRAAGAWHGEIGGWGYYYADRLDNPHTTQGDYLRYGGDVALGYGPLSFTGAFSVTHDERVLGLGPEDDSRSWLAQLGLLIPGTRFELAVRYSGYDYDLRTIATSGRVQEFAAGVNLYLDGHRSKLQFDAAYIEATDQGILIFDTFPGYPGPGLGGEESGWLLRFQWQLAL